MLKLRGRETSGFQKTTEILKRGTETQKGRKKKINWRRTNRTLREK